MGAAFLALGVVATVVVGLVVAVTFVPFHWVVRADSRTGFRLRGRWLFGWVRFSAPRREAPRSAPPPHAALEREETRRPRRRRSRLAHRILAIDGLVPRLARLARDLVRGLGWRRGWVEVRVGLGDPALTGELCGLVGPWLVAQPRAVRLHFEPVFEAEAFHAEAGACGRLRPARLLGALGRFAVSRPGRRVLAVLAWRR